MSSIAATRTPLPSESRAASAADMVVPVCGASRELLACVSSVRRHTDLARHRLILVADGPQDAETEAVLAGEVSRGQIELLRQPQRRGFPAAVNRGLALAAGDVVLLNSDTVVTEGWIEKLAAAAHSGERIASATPFSNAATICSLPRWLEDNAIPAGWTIDRFAALVAENSAREYPNLPTGVGVCMYLRREAIAEAGLFDEAFGLGYGEEVDWCRRAARLGWRHVLDDATFIFHAGQASFGTGRGARVGAANRRVRRRDPSYWPDLAAFIRRDPLREARQRVLDAMPRAATPAATRPAPRGGPRRVLHVVHGWPPWSRAGTELYAAWLARWQAGFREVVALARVADSRRSTGQALELLDAGVRVRLLVNNFDQRNPLARNALHDRRIAADFAGLLEAVQPELVHVHHLAGHCASLVRAAKDRRLPVVYQLQDWYTGCARANLLDRDRRLCRGPSALRCARCLPLTGVAPAAMWSSLLHLVRRHLLRAALRRADVLVCGSAYLARSFAELGWLPRGRRIQVLPYAVPAAQPAPSARSGGPLRCGILGSWLPHKGIHVALAAWRDLPPGLAQLRLWGAPIDAAYAAELRGLATPDVRFEEPFEEWEIGRVLGELDLLIVPSLGLESFGLAAREALAHGVPVLAARRGALGEIFEPQAAGGECGALFDPEKPGELTAWVRRLAAQPKLLRSWQEARPPGQAFPVHAEEIETIYERLVAQQ